MGLLSCQPIHLKVYRDVDYQKVVWTKEYSVTKGDRTNLRPLAALELRTIPDNPQVQPFNQVFSIHLFLLVRKDPNIPLKLSESQSL